MLITYALGRAAAQGGNPILISYLLLLVLIGIAASILVYVWRGIPQTISHLTKPHAQGPPRVATVVPELDPEIEALLGQHQEFALNVEAFRERRRSKKPPPPKVPLPA
jgi:hypothetical protein